MTNFIFKSANRLIKNSPITGERLDRKLDFILSEQRKQRADLVDIKRMINRITIDKHLQSEVDDFFNRNESIHPEDKNDLD